MTQPLSGVFAAAQVTHSRAWADLRDAGLPEFDAEGHRLDFHSFRHTTGTWLLANGASMKTVQMVLGHRTFKQTADTYAHVDLKHLKAEMAKLPDVSVSGCFSGSRVIRDYPGRLSRNPIFGGPKKGSWNL